MKLVARLLDATDGRIQMVFQDLADTLNPRFTVSPIAVMICERGGPIEPTIASAK